MLIVIVHATSRRNNVEVRNVHVELIALCRDYICINIPMSYQQTKKWGAIHERSQMWSHIISVIRPTVPL